jgi:hypothetical protein|tara:strand:+ start:9970 stop:10161 length:192 start_codon:yes stop_codon:yes gene_type:complete
MGVEIQKVISYNRSGDLDSKKIVLPKIINTDIGFQIQFGMNPPKDVFKGRTIMKEYKTPQELK